MRTTLLALLALLAAGCQSHQTTRTITRAQVGTDTARLTGYMKLWNGWQEEVPGAIQHSVLLDEATLTKAGPEACASAIVRTASADDEPIDQLSPKFRVDGRDVEALVKNETVSVRDYSFTGMESVMVVDGVALDKYAGLAVSRPAEKVFRVVERRAELCAETGLASSLSLWLGNKRMGTNATFIREFVWIFK